MRLLLLSVLELFKLLACALIGALIGLGVAYFELGHILFSFLLLGFLVSLLWWGRVCRESEKKLQQAEDDLIRAFKIAREK